MTFSLLLLLCLFFLLSPIQTQQLSNSTDFFALYTLRSSLSIRSTYWPLKSDPCTTWTGVQCLSGRVVSISLTGLRRTRIGRLNPQFSVDALQNLSHLTTFNASGFYLPGSIPIWFGRQLGSGFTTLDLGFTGVTGSIPAELALLSSLKSLVLSHNNITGMIPSQLGYVPSLSHIDIGFNNLTGSVPDSIWALPELNYLDLSSNQLTGQVPHTLPTRRFRTLYTFNLSNNLFHGKVSPAVESFMRSFNLSDISNNYFEGSLNTHVIANMNCFSNASNQRSISDCTEFYKQRGLLYDQFTNLPSALAPTMPNLPTTEASFRSKLKKSKTKKNKKKYILAGSIGAAGLIVLLAIIMFVIICICSRKNRTQPMSRRGSGLTSSVHAQASPIATLPVPTSPTGTQNPSAVADSFTFDKLARATSDFAEDKCLKHGHTGDIYHGMLEDGSHVAVKRVNGSLVKKEGVIGELSFFEKMTHSRFVPFLGRFVRDEDKVEFFVYRFMPKGDLTGALHKRHKEELELERESQLEELPSLDWITRLKIATGVAEALCILHQECNPPIVHRDIQASSILLDDKFEVRLGSLSEICAQQGDGHNSVFSRILKSSKSLDKAISGPPAACSYDVFCLGKVLLELVTGKLGLSGSDDPATADWIEMALTHIAIHDRDLIVKIIDPSLFLYEDHLEEVWAMALVAKSCLNSRPSKRPPARYVLKALENPLRVVREEERSSSLSGRIRSMSNRSSWRGAFHGSWRFGSDIASSGQVVENRSFRHSMKSQGSEKSFTQKRSSQRSSREVVPEPSDLEEGVIEIKP